MHGREGHLGAQNLPQIKQERMMQVTNQLSKHSWRWTKFLFKLVWSETLQTPTKN